MYRVYSYVVAEDGGYAPNVDRGVCTLCICKPRVRSTASPGDWVVGLWPAPNHKCVTYVMRIGRVLPMEEYAECREFDHKKPAQSRTPDNIYEFDPLLGPRRREDTPPDLHPEPAEMKTDLDGRNVLIADRFWYFGGTRCELPERFWKLDFPKPRARRNHRTESLTDTELDTLIEWLDSHGSGVIGSPRDGVPQERGVYRAGSAGCGQRGGMHMRSRPPRVARQFPRPARPTFDFSHDQGGGNTMRLKLRRNPRNPTEPNRGDTTTPAGWWPYAVDGVKGRAYIPANWFPGEPPEELRLDDDSDE